MDVNTGELEEWEKYAFFAADAIEAGMAVYGAADAVFGVSTPSTDPKLYGAAASTTIRAGAGVYGSYQHYFGDEDEADRAAGSADEWAETAGGVAERIAGSLGADRVQGAPVKKSGGGGLVLVLVLAFVLFGGK